MENNDKQQIGGYFSTKNASKDEALKGIVAARISASEDITDKEYTVRGCTALLDAIGGAIHHIGNVHKYARAEDVPEHTLFIIVTDGKYYSYREQGRL